MRFRLCLKCVFELNFLLTKLLEFARQYVDDPFFLCFVGIDEIFFSLQAAV
jgi:hypothetical protein